MKNQKLYEAIMRGIEKSLNEGFKAWRDENTPKFDIDKFKTNLEKIVSILKGLAADGEISNFVLFNDNFRKIIYKYKNIDNTDIANINISAEQFVANVVDNASKLYPSKDEFAEEMPKSVLWVKVVSNKYLFRYIKDDMNPGNPTTLKSNDYIKLRGDGDVLSFCITTTDIMDHFQDIVNWFE